MYSRLHKEQCKSQPFAVNQWPTVFDTATAFSSTRTAVRRGRRKRCFLNKENEATIELGSPTEFTILGTIRHRLAQRAPSALSTGKDAQKKKTAWPCRLFSWMKKKLRVLFLSAFSEELHPGREIREIEERIRQSIYRDKFDIATVWAVRPRDIAGALRRHSPNIVHFTGHGERDVGIFLEDDAGKQVAVSPDTFCRFFEPLRGITQGVILNACETQPVAEALRYLVDYVIAMREPISDEAAIMFSAALYEELASGQSVRTAFDQALTQLRIAHRSEADIPELIERPAAPPLIGTTALKKRKSPRPVAPPQLSTGMHVNVAGNVETVTNVNGPVTTLNVNRRK